MGIAVRRGRRGGPLLQGRRKKRKFPKCLERPQRSSLSTVHHFLPQIASLFFHFTWLYDVKMLLLSHVSSLVLCLYHECVRVRVCMYVRAHGFSTHGITHGVYGVGECVCVHLPSS